MTITLQAVNELIASLESAGELSIREQKFLKLAKAYQQLAAENAGMKKTLSTIANSEEYHGDMVVCDFDTLVTAACSALHTPATDRIVAGIKADGVEEFAKFMLRDACGDKESQREIGEVLDASETFAKQLREGVDK
ncbi:TPA: hypothetical protein ACGBXG_002790 [Klebsiella variicola]